MSALQEVIEDTLITSFRTPGPLMISLGPDAGEPMMSLAENEHYLNVPEGEIVSFTFILPTQQAVKFENPPITLANPSPLVVVTRVSDLEAQMTVDNSVVTTPGVSFYYTLRAVHTTPTNAQRPLRLDPTVHNDPPS
jgi:hypothetical protein